MKKDDEWNEGVEENEDKPSESEDDTLAEESEADEDSGDENLE